MRRVRGDLELVFGQGLTNSRLLPDTDMLKYTFGHFQYYFEKRAERVVGNNLIPPIC